MEAKPQFRRGPVHPSIQSSQIDALVETFYTRVREDDRLGPVFGKRLDGQWDEHLETMKRFWRSILLKTGEYKGAPMPAHMRLNEVAPDDFRIWLALFRQTAQECFSAEAAGLVIAAAERIAQSFWLGMFGKPFSSPPEWMQSQPSTTQVQC